MSGNTKKEKDPNVATRHIVRTLPIPFKPGDKEAQHQHAILMEQYALARPLEAEITRLDMKLKPIKKEIDKALTVLKGGKQTQKDCTVTIDHNERWIKIVRDDTGEVLEDREALEDELQPDAFDE